MLHWFGYVVRRLRDMGRPCGVRGCAGATVGASVWCRVHTDEILEGRVSSELQAELDALGHL